MRMRLAVAAALVSVVSFAASAAADAPNPPFAPVTPVSVAPGQPDVTQTVDVGDHHSVTTTLGTDIISGTPGTAISAPSGCARTHLNITYTDWLTHITEFTMSHAVQGCYSNYKINSVSENAVYQIDTCCGWSWTGMQYHYRNPEVIPASPVQFNAQGGFQYCIGPACITSRSPGSIIQLNGNWIVTGYKWWLG